MTRIVILRYSKDLRLSTPDVDPSEYLRMTSGSIRCRCNQRFTPYNPGMGPDTDEAFLARALELAAGGRGSVEPNPMVGCVLVKDGRVIGEGYHAAFGQPHAEAVALAACSESPAGATAYVNLEPCSHTNKKTRPCAPRLIAAGIRRVVIGCEDPNPAVAGGGIEQLRAVGVEVAVGIRQSESRQLNAPFFARQVHGRPYVTLKWAESADGKVAGRDGRPLQISNERSNGIVHALRRRCDAILVGINTVLRDDPLLTVRGLSAQKGGTGVPPVLLQQRHGRDARATNQETRSLRRIVLDSRARIPLERKVVATARQWPLHVFVSQATTKDSAGASNVDALRARGVHVETVASDCIAPLSLEAVLKKLAELDVTHLLVEGGPTVHEAFFRQNLADRVWVFRSPKIVGELNAPGAAVVPTNYVMTGEVLIDRDVLSEYHNPNSAVFFNPSASIDLNLASLSANH